jgi:hypothetical protein
MELRPPTQDEQVITHLVTIEERLRDVITSQEIEREQLEWYLVETLGDDWKYTYYRWREINAKELKKHRAEIESEYK